jgi:hypothetical protein
MALILLFVFLAVAGLANGSNVTIQNNRNETVCIRIEGKDGVGQPENRCFDLASGQSVSMEL